MKTQSDCLATTSHRGFYTEYTIEFDVDGRRTGWARPGGAGLDGGLDMTWLCRLCTFIKARRGRCHHHYRYHYHHHHHLACNGRVLLGMMASGTESKVPRSSEKGVSRTRVVGG
ncbi:uncharacterized protein PV07_12331 [Cladophialophora immunda]|uniref:Uncharacterized protein n=1 Tax=Cladophialophora immunda TaxID=569365 RepID=A0A0D1Z4A4_9EURO|nr:uncharacterized protein PV07_12331 [Cladophialophora immunda]KIW22446.1 hypothetical protein PV07_12331 [Cladophialophora immunda]